jgi:hypothetical protein
MSHEARNQHRRPYNHVLIAQRENDSLEDRTLDLASSFDDIKPFRGAVILRFIKLSTGFYVSSEKKRLVYASTSVMQVLIMNAIMISINQLSRMFSDEKKSTHFNAGNISVCREH